MRRQLTILVAITALTVGPATVSGATPYAPDTPPASAAPLQSAGSTAAEPGSAVTPAATVAGDERFDWGDAGIVAGTVAAVALLAVGLGVSLRHHRHSPVPR